MKVVVNLTIIFSFIVNIVFAQTISDLNAEQKTIYNRNKLTIEVTQQSMGSGFGGYGSVSYSGQSWYQWRAYRGIGHRISEAEFFKITGYPREASIAMARYNKLKSGHQNSLSLMGGSALAFISSFFFMSSDETFGLSIILMLGGIAGFFGGVGVSAKYSTLLKRNYTPYKSVEGIMNEYNSNLIKEIINQ